MIAEWLNDSLLQLTECLPNQLQTNNALVALANPKSLMKPQNPMDKIDLSSLLHHHLKEYLSTAEYLKMGVALKLFLPIVDLQKKCQPASLYPHLVIKGRISLECVKIIQKCFKEYPNFFESFTYYDWRYIDVLPIDTLVITNRWNNLDRDYIANLSPINVSRIEIISDSGLDGNMISLILDSVINSSIIKKILEFKVADLDLNWSDKKVLLARYVSTIIGTAGQLEQLEFEKMHILRNMWESIHNAKSLKKLDLGLADIYDKDQLRRLYRGNQLTELRGYNILMEEMKYATNLKKLYIQNFSWNQNSKVLNELKQLETLELHAPFHSGRSGWHGSVKLPKMKHLTMMAGISIYNYDLYENWNTLESWAFTYHSYLNKFNLKRFSNLTRIRIIGLNSDSVPHDLFKSVPKLEHLELVSFSNVQFSDISEYSYNLKSLVIKLGGRNRSQEDFNKISKFIGAFPNLEYLELNNSQDLNMEDLEKFPQLLMVVHNGVEYQRDLETWKFREVVDLQPS